MNTLLVILAVWVVASVPLALLVARLFRSPRDEDPDPPPRDIDAELSILRRRDW